MLINSLSVGLGAEADVNGSVTAALQKGAFVFIVQESGSKNHIGGVLQAIPGSLYDGAIEAAVNGPSLVNSRQLWIA